MSWTDSQVSGDCIDFSEWNTMTAAMQAHSNTWHSDNYYYQESDLTAVLNDNYPGSSNIYNRTWIDAFSGNLDTRIDAAGGVSTFTALTDTPSAYAGSGNKLAVVNGSEDKIVFREIVCTNTDVVIAGASVVLV